MKYYIILLLSCVLIACKYEQDREQKRETVEERIERESRLYCDYNEIYFPAVFSRWEACIHEQYFGEFVSATFAGRKSNIPEDKFRIINTGRFSDD